MQSNEYIEDAVFPTNEEMIEEAIEENRGEIFE